MLIFILTKNVTPSCTLFPYTTLFRSHRAERLQRHDGIDDQGPVGAARHVRRAERRRCSRRSEEHTSELQSHSDLVCRLLLEKKTSTTSIDIMGLQAAYANLHTDQERD